VSAELAKHDLKTFTILRATDQPVVLAVNAMNAMGEADKAQHLLMMVRAGRVRAGPVEGLLATTAMVEGQENIILSNAYPAYNSDLEQALSLVHETGAANRFNLTHEVNTAREEAGRIQLQNMVGKDFSILTTFFGGDEERTREALMAWQREMKEKLGQDKTLEQMSTFKDDERPDGVEYFRLTDSEGAYTGAIRPRDLSHLDGTWHRAVAVLLVDKEGRLLVQVRSDTKKFFPGCRDCSSAGHMALTEKYIDGAIKETEEEVFDSQVKLDPSRMVLVGKEAMLVFKHEPRLGLKDWERVSLFIYFVNDEEKAKVKKQESEVKEVQWVDFDEEISRWQAWHNDPPKSREAGIDYACLGIDILSNPEVVAAIRGVIERVNVKTIIDWLSEREALPAKIDLLWLLGSPFSKVAIGASALWERIKGNPDARILITGGIGRARTNLAEVIAKGGLPQEAESKLNEILDRLAVIGQQEGQEALWAQIGRMFNIYRGRDKEKLTRNTGSARDEQKDWFRFCEKYLSPAELLDIKNGVRLIEDVMMSKILDKATRYSVPIPEGIVYYAILLVAGVDAGRILVDAQSTTTVENIIYGTQILREANLKPAVIVLMQEPYIQKRAKATFLRKYPALIGGIEGPLQVVNYAPYNYEDVLLAGQERFAQYKEGALAEVKKLGQYPNEGRTVTVEIPQDVMRAYSNLVEHDAPTVAVVLIGSGEYALKAHLHAIKEFVGKGDCQLAAIVDFKTSDGKDNEHTIKLRKFITEMGLDLERIKIVIAHAMKGPWRNNPPSADDIENVLGDKIRNAVEGFAVKAAVISTWGTAHKPYIEWAIRNDFHVLVDKPLTIPLGSQFDQDKALQFVRDYDDLMRISNQKPQLLFMIATQKRYSDLFQKTARRIRSLKVDGEIMPIEGITYEVNDGYLNFVTNESGGSMVRPNRPEYGNGSIAGKNKHGAYLDSGKLTHSGYHFLDIIPWMLRNTGKVYTKARVFAVSQKPHQLASINDFKIDSERNVRHVDEQEKVENRPSEKLFDVNDSILIEFITENGFTCSVFLRLEHGGIACAPKMVKIEHFRVVQSFGGEIHYERKARLGDNFSLEEVGGPNHRQLSYLTSNIINHDGGSIKNEPVDLEDDAAPAREFLKVLINKEDFSGVISPAKDHSIGIKLMSAVHESAIIGLPVEVEFDKSEWAMPVLTTSSQEALPVKQDPARHLPAPIMPLEMRGIPYKKIVEDALARLDWSTVTDVPQEMWELMARGLEETGDSQAAAKLRWMGRAGLLKGAPLQGFLATTIIKEGQEYILVSTYYPAYRTRLETALSLGHEIRALSTHGPEFNLTDEKNSVREVILRQWLTNKRGQDPATRHITAMEAVEEVRANVVNQQLQADPQVRQRSDKFLNSRILKADETVMGMIQDKVRRGVSKPLRRAKLLKYSIEDDGPVALEDVDPNEEIQIGYMPIAGNPPNHGHLIPPLFAIALLGLDFVAIRVQGKIGYKKLRRSEKVSTEHRHMMTKLSIDRMWPLLRYTDFASEPDNMREGFEELLQLMEHNRGQRAHFVQLLGIENEERVVNYYQQFYKILKENEGKIDPLHRISIGWIQRGKFGLNVTQERMELYNQHAKALYGGQMNLPVLLLKHPQIDLAISSTRYRYGQDAAIIPLPAHEFAQAHGYYNHPPIDAKTGKPLFASPLEYLQSCMTPFVIPIVRHIRELLVRGVTGNSPIITIDGGSGSGKTIIAKLVDSLLAKFGLRVEVLEQDWFLRDVEWREAVMKVVAHDPASGSLVLTDREKGLLGDLAHQLKPGEKCLGEEGFFDNAQALELLKALYEFRASGAESQKYTVKNAYFRGNEDVPSERKDHEITFRKNTVYIFEGKYTNTEAFLPYTDLRYRLNDDKDRTAVRFEDRTRKKKSSEISDIQMVFYGLSLVPSFEAYDERTKDFIHAFVDLRGEDWFLKERLSEKLFGGSLKEQFKKWMDDFSGRSLAEVLEKLYPADKDMQETFHDVIVFWVNHMFDALQRHASTEHGRFVQGDFGVEIYGFDRGVRIVFIHNGEAFNPAQLKGLMTRAYWQGREPLAMSRLLGRHVRGFIENKTPPLAGLLVEFEHPDVMANLSELSKEDETIQAGARMQIDVLYDRARPIESKDAPNSVHIFRQDVDFASNGKNGRTFDGGYNNWSVDKSEIWLKEKEVEGKVRPASEQERQQLVPRIDKARAFLSTENNPHVPTERPELFIVDSEKEGFVAYYRKAENKLFVVSSILHNSDYDLDRVMVHELNGQSDAENRQVEDKFVSQQTPLKCLVLDCDGVLWDGIVGEESRDGIRLTQAHLEFQRQVKALKDKGVLLAINSKNNPEAVMDVLEHHPNMVLRKTDFVVMKINWQDKASNIKDIAAELNIGIDSLVFVDDNPHECALVGTMLPQVQVLNFPAQPQQIAAVTKELETLFNIKSSTDEDARRTQLYTDRKARQDLEAASRTKEEYYKNLEMQVLIRSGQENLDYIPRIVQLMERTHQFNLTGQKYTEDYLRTALAQENPREKVYSFEFIDRFGNAGMVGVMIVSKIDRESSDWEISVFCLSCRVIGLTAEKAFVSYVVQDLRNAGIQKLYARYSPIEGNANFLVKDLYDQIGFTKTSPFSWEVDLGAYTLAWPAYIGLVSHKNDSQVTDISDQQDLETLARQWFAQARQRGLETSILETAWRKMQEENQDPETLRKLLAIERTYLGLEVKMGEVSGQYKTCTIECTYLRDTINELESQGYVILKKECIDVDREGSNIYETWKLFYAYPNQAQVKRYAKPFYFHLYTDRSGEQIRRAYDWSIYQGWHDLFGASPESPASTNHEKKWAFLLMTQKNLNDAPERAVRVGRIYDLCITEGKQHLLFPSESGILPRIPEINKVLNRMIQEKLEVVGVADGGYNNWSVDESEGWLKEKEDEGKVRPASPEEKDYLMPCIDKARAFLNTENNPHVPTERPELFIVDSEKEGFGTYYRKAEKKLFVVSSILHNSDYDLDRVMVHELNAGDHAANETAEGRYVASIEGFINQLAASGNLSQKTIEQAHQQAVIAENMVRRQGYPYPVVRGIPGYPLPPLEQRSREIASVLQGKKIQDAGLVPVTAQMPIALLALKGLFKNGYVFEAWMLEGMIAAGHVRAGPFQGFLATTYDEDSVRYALLSNHPECAQYLDEIQQAASLVYLSSMSDEPMAGHRDNNALRAENFLLDQLANPQLRAFVRNLKQSGLPVFCDLTLEAFLLELEGKFQLALGAGGLGFLAGETFGVHNALWKFSGVGVMPLYENHVNKATGERTHLDWPKEDDESSKGAKPVFVYDANGNKHILTLDVAYNKGNFKVEVYWLNRNGNLVFLLRQPAIFDQLYPYQDHQIYQQGFLGRAFVELMKSLWIAPSIVRLNEPQLVYAATAMKDDIDFFNNRHGRSIFNDTKIAGTTHTPEPAAIQHGPVGRMTSIVGWELVRDWDGAREIVENGEVNTAKGLGEVATLINGVAEEHARVTQEIIMPAYAGKTIGIQNGSDPKQWYSPPLAQRVAEVGVGCVTGKELYDFGQQMKGQLNGYLNRNYGCSFTDINRPLVGLVRRMVDYKEQGILFPIVRWIVGDRHVEYDVPWGKEKGLGANLLVGGVGQDDSGIAWVNEFTRQMHIEDLKGKFIFVNNTGIELMRLAASASDIWVSMPRATREASGTSDNRAAFNGHLNIATATGGPLAYIIHGATGWLIDVFQGWDFRELVRKIDSRDMEVLEKFRVEGRRQLGTFLKAGVSRYYAYKPDGTGDRTWIDNMQTAFIKAHQEVSIDVMWQKYGLDFESILDGSCKQGYEAKYKAWQARAPKVFELQGWAQGFLNNSLGQALDVKTRSELFDRLDLEKDTMVVPMDGRGRVRVIRAQAANEILGPRAQKVFVGEASLKEFADENPDDWIGEGLVHGQTSTLLQAIDHRQAQEGTTIDPRTMLSPPGILQENHEAYEAALAQGDGSVIKQIISDENARIRDLKNQRHLSRDDWIEGHRWALSRFPDEISWRQHYGGLYDNILNAPDDESALNLHQSHNNRWRTDLPLVAIFDPHGVFIETGWRNVFAEAYKRIMGVTQEQAMQWVEAHEGEDLYQILMTVSKLPKEETRRIFEESKKSIEFISVPKLLPGAEKLLASLKEQKVEVVVTTGTSRELAVSHLSEDGLNEYIRFEDLITRDEMMRSQKKGAVYDEGIRNRTIEGLALQFPGYRFAYFNDGIGGMAGVREIDGLNIGIGGAQISDKLIQLMRQRAFAAGAEVFVNKGLEDYEYILKLLQINKHVQAQAPTAPVYLHPAREVPVILPAPRVPGICLFIDMSDDFERVTYYEVTDDTGVHAVDGTVNYNAIRKIKLAEFPSQHLMSPIGYIERFVSPEIRDRIVALWHQNKRYTRYGGVTVSWDLSVDRNVWTTNIDTVYLHARLLDLILNPLHPIKKVTEIGSGGGALSTLLAARTKGLEEMTFTDISIYALRTTLRNVLPFLLRYSPEVVLRHFLGQGMGDLSPDQDLIVANTPYIPVAPWESSDENDPYRGTGLIREIMEKGMYKLNPLNPEASIVMNVSSMAKPDFDRYVEANRDKIIVEKMGEAMTVPLKIKAVDGRWAQWLFSENLIKLNPNVENDGIPYVHTLQLYRIRPKPWVLATPLRREKDNVESQVFSDTRKMTQAFAPLLEDPRGESAQRIKRLFPEIFAYLSQDRKKMNYDGDSQKQEGEYNQALIRHIIGRGFGRKLLGMELGDPTVFQAGNISPEHFSSLVTITHELERLGLLPYVRAAFLYHDVSKIDDPLIKQEWANIPGIDFNLVNQASVLVLRQLASVDSHHRGLFENIAVLRECPHHDLLNELFYQVLGTRGLLGMKVRGEITGHLFMPFILWVREHREELGQVLQTSSPSETAQRITDLVFLFNILDVASLREGLLDERLFTQMRKVTDALVELVASNNDPEAIFYSHGETGTYTPRNQLVRRLKRFRHEAITLGDVPDTIDKLIDEGLADEEIQIFSGLLSRLQAWYIESATLGLSAEAMVKLLAVGVRMFKRRNPDHQGPFHITFFDLMKTLTHDGKTYDPYLVRIIEAMLRRYTLKEILTSDKVVDKFDPSSKDPEAFRLAGIALDWAGSQAIGFDIELTNEGVDAKHMMRRYEARAEVKAKQLLKYFLEYYGIRKDEFDRVSDDVHYWETMRGAAMNKARVFHYFASGGAFVDIGDADGMLLEQAEQHRIDKQMTEAIGVDLSSTAVEKMRKIIKEKQLHARAIHGDAADLVELFKQNKVGQVMNIVFCSILHEIFSYSIKHGKRFDLETVKDVLRAALQVLPEGGRIPIRDGVVPENAMEEQVLELRGVKSRETFDMFMNGFEARDNYFSGYQSQYPSFASAVREIYADPVAEIWKLQMPRKLAAEFLMKFTWVWTPQYNPSGFMDELREQYQVLKRSEWVALLHELARELGMQISEVEIPVEERAFLQQGYVDNLAGKARLLDLQGNEVSLPDSNMLIVIEKKNNIRPSDSAKPQEGQSPIQSRRALGWVRYINGIRGELKDKGFSPRRIALSFVKLFITDLMIIYAWAKYWLMRVLLLEHRLPPGVMNWEFLEIARVQNGQTIYHPAFKYISASFLTQAIKVHEQTHINQALPSEVQAYTQEVNVNWFDVLIASKRDRKIIIQEEYERLCTLRNGNSKVMSYMNYMILMALVKPVSVLVDCVLGPMATGIALHSGLSLWWGGAVGYGVIWLFGVGVKAVIILLMYRKYKWSALESLGLWGISSCLGIIYMGVDLAAMPLLLEGKALWRGYRYKEQRPEVLRLFWLLLNVNLPFRSLRSSIVRRRNTNTDFIRPGLIKKVREGQGCTGNVAPQNVKGIKQLIAEKAFDEVDVDKKIFEGIVDVPVKVFILTKQVPRGPPEGFIWDRITRGKNPTLEIYYSSPLVYEGNKDLLMEDAYHGLIENRLLQNRRINKLTPAQAHAQAVEETAQRFPPSAFRLSPAVRRLGLVKMARLFDELKGQRQRQKPVVGVSRSRQPSSDEIRFHDYFEKIDGKAGALCVLLSQRMQGDPADLPGTLARRDELVNEILDIALKFTPQQFKELDYQEKARQLAALIVRAAQLIIDNNDEPAAISCLRAVSERINQIKTELLDRRIAGRSPLAATVSAQGGKVVVHQQRYQLQPDGESPMLSDSASKHESSWESFRSICDTIKNELNERRIIRGLIVELNNLILRLAKGENIVPELKGILENLGDIANLRVEEKRSAWRNISSASQVLQSGDRHRLTARGSLVKAVRCLETRSQRLAVKARYNLDNRLGKIEEHIKGRNNNLKERIEAIENILKNSSSQSPAARQLRVEAAQGRMYGIVRLKAVKGQPDLSLLYGVLWQALRSLKAGEEVESFCHQARAGIDLSSSTFTAWREYIQGLVNVELNAAVAADPIAVFEKIFQQSTQQLARGGLVKEQAIYWARLYQAIFIPLNIDGAQRGERVPNPVFKAATFYQDILKRYTLAKLIDWRLMSENTRKNTVAFLRQIQETTRRTHLIREDLPGLMTAIADDYKLNDAQRTLLKGCVRLEPRTAPMPQVDDPLGEPVFATEKNFKKIVEDMIRRILQDKTWRGIIIADSETTAVGIPMLANKTLGVRCALCTDPVTVGLTREHNNSNILVLVKGSPDNSASIDMWRNTNFAGGRHQIRLDLIGKNIQTPTAVRTTGPPAPNTIAIGCDHGAFALKEIIKVLLQSVGGEVTDVGTNSLDSCNYPDFGTAAANLVGIGQCAYALVLCTTGIGISYAANHNPNVFCALCHTPGHARIAREIYNANAMALGERSTSSKNLLDIVAKLKAFFPHLAWDNLTEEALAKIRTVDYLPVNEEVYLWQQRQKLDDEKFAPILEDFINGHNDQEAIKRFPSREAYLAEVRRLVMQIQALPTLAGRIAAHRNNNLAYLLEPSTHIALMVQWPTALLPDKVLEQSTIMVVVAQKPVGPSSLAMLPGKARRFVEWVAERITHNKFQMRFWDWPVVWLAYLVMRINAYWEQAQLETGWKTHGLRGWTWQEFVDLHPDKKDQEYINEKLKSKLDFSSNPKLLFSASVRDHYRNNCRWLLFGQGRLAMSGGKSARSVAQNSDKQKDSEKQFKKERKTIVAFLILLLLLFLGVFFLWMIFMKGIKPCGCVCKFFPASSLMYKPGSGTVVWLWGVLHYLLIRTRRAKSACGIPPIRRIGGQCPKEQQMPLRGQSFARNDTTNVSQHTINMPPNVGPTTGTAIFLSTIVKPLSVFEWPITRWWLYSVRVVYVTIIRPVITVVERQFVLWIKTSMGVPLGGKGFWTGFNNLVPPIITVFTCSISYTSTTYAYVTIF